MRVLITGASRGIGRAVCARLARDGAQVAACASAHGDELNALVAEIRLDEGLLGREEILRRLDAWWAAR